MGLSWWQIRQRVWQRDGGICQVCTRAIPAELYECGHKVDRVCGGSDSLDNCVAMCLPCNRTKPLHETSAEYDAWLASNPVRQQAERLEARQWSGPVGPHWESGYESLEANEAWEVDRAHTRQLVRDLNYALLMAAWWGPEMSTQALHAAYDRFMQSCSWIDRFAIESAFGPLGWYCRNVEGS